MLASKFRTVEGKLFLVLLTSLVVVGMGFIVVHHNSELNSTKSDFVSQYSKTLNFAANSVLQLEADAEERMKVAIGVLMDSQSKDVKPVSEMRSLAAKLGMTHIFEADSHGNYLLSTNEDPRLIPNMFSFCQEYKALQLNANKVEVTPIIPPVPEISPYKFAIVFNPRVSRYASVGLRVDFLQRALQNLILSDRNIVSVNIYTPKGVSLGTFSNSEFKYSRISDKEAPKRLNGVIETDNSFKFYQWLDSPHPDSCQCITSGETRAGKHQYLFELNVSKDFISRAVKAEGGAFAVYSSIWLLLSFAISRLVARLFTRKIRMLADSVSMASSLDQHVNLKMAGTDEVSTLSRLFDSLVLQIRENSEAEIIEERRATQIELSQQVAHDIRSPLAALELALTKVENAPSEVSFILKNSVNRIRRIADKLAKDYLSNTSSERTKIYSASEIFKVVKFAVDEKRIEVSERSNIAIILKAGSHEIAPVAVELDLGELNTILSNLLNNSVEAIKNKNGRIEIDFAFSAHEFKITISDDGCGIAPNISDKIGVRGASFGKPNGSGLGLYYAKRIVAQWSGKITWDSGRTGTVMTITLPNRFINEVHSDEVRMSPTADVIVLDDDEHIHRYWEQRLSRELKMPNRLVFISDSKGFNDFFSARFHELQDAVFLIDFDLKNSSETGVDLIEKFGITEQALLVTGRHSDPKLKAKCRELNLRLVSKDQISNLRFLASS